MIGDSKNPGLYLLAASDVFQYIQQFRDQGIFIQVSYFEIYCGKLFDLLNERKKLQAREDAKQNINVVGLKRFGISNPQELFEMINLGNSIRITSTTGKNLDSSRSHAILQIYVMEGQKQKGILSFIDLAGNERGADTYDHDMQTRIDGAEISKSLLALKECIRALDQDKKHVPFRGSKLTMVLKDSFIGNCKTVMIGNVSPALPNCEYTLNTLRYADRVKELKKDNKDKGGSKNELLLPRQGNNINRYEIKPENPFGPNIVAFNVNNPKDQAALGANNLNIPLPGNQINGPTNFLAGQNKLMVKKVLKPAKFDNKSQDRSLSNQHSRDRSNGGEKEDFKPRPMFQNPLEKNRPVNLLHKPHKPNREETLEELNDKHADLINRILVEEEKLIKKHYAHLNLMSNSNDIVM
jgi:kinesin family protein 2/24